MKKEPVSDKNDKMENDRIIKQQWTKQLQTIITIRTIRTIIHISKTRKIEFSAIHIHIWQCQIC